MRKSLAAAFLLLLLFHSPAARADEPQAPEPVRVVVAVLELSEDQVQAFVAMIAGREAAVRPAAEQLRLRHEALGQLLQTPAPDPAAVGTLVLEIRAIEAEIGRVAQSAAAQFEQVLTPDQRERLMHLRQAAQVCPVLPAFKAAGLL